MRRLLALIALILLITTGCWDRRPVDELALIDSITIDKATEDNNSIIVSVIRPTFEKNKKDFDHKATAEATGILQALDKLQNKSSQIYLLGAVRNVLIGRKAAEDGMNEILSELDHISDFETQAFVVVYDSTIKEFEEFKPPQQERAGILILHTLMSSVTKQRIPECKFYKVMSVYSLEGQELVLPIVKISEKKDSISIEEFGIFKQDKLVGRIDLDEGIPYLLTVLPSVDEMHINIPSEEIASDVIDNLTVVVRKRKINIETTVNQDVINISVGYDLTIDLKALSLIKHNNIESCQNIMEEEDLIKEIELSVQNYLKKSTDLLVAKTQNKFKSDIFGFGEKFRIQNNKHFQQIDWCDVYPNANISSSVKVELRKMGSVK